MVGHPLSFRATPFRFGTSFCFQVRSTVGMASSAFAVVRSLIVNRPTPLRSLCRERSRDASSGRCAAVCCSALSIGQMVAASRLVRARSGKADTTCTPAPDPLRHRERWRSTDESVKGSRRIRLSPRARGGAGSLCEGVARRQGCRRNRVRMEYGLAFDRAGAASRGDGVRGWCRSSSSVARESRVGLAVYMRGASPDADGLDCGSGTGSPGDVGLVATVGETAGSQ